LLERLHHSGEWFHSLVRNASDVITVLDADGTIRYDSPAVERVLGYKPEERIGTNVFDYVHPNDTNRGSGILNEIQANPETPVTIEFRLRHADGSWPPWK
jgi:PAS domain S-box-containing protein